MFKQGINVIHGRGCSGKTSIIDAFLFLQLYSYYYGSTIKNRILTDPTLYSYMGETEFSIMTGLKINDNEYFFRIDVDTEKPEYVESYIIRDTVFTYRPIGRLSIKDARRSKYIPPGYNAPRDTLWDRIGKWRLVISNLPWNSLGHLVSVESSYWGGIDEAIKHVPEIISRILASKIRLSDRELLTEIRIRLKELFTYVFITHRFLRGIVVLKYIDYKNAVGPSKHVSRIFDPYASNFPWIYLSLIKNGKSDEISRYLRNMGYDYNVSIGSTIDNRYYLILTQKNKALYLFNLPTSLIKTLIILSTIFYSNGVVVIDDFEEFLDEKEINQLLEIFRRNTIQLIATSRSGRIKGEHIIHL